MDKSYKDFMFDSNNICNCTSCPENQNFSAWPGRRLPCGQFNCWVSLYCEKDDDEDDE